MHKFRSYRILYNIQNSAGWEKVDDEYDTSEDENITEIETYEDYGEKIHETEESIPVETS